MIQEIDQLSPSDQGRDRRYGGRNRWSIVLLVIPFIALLWTPFYNSVDPQLSGIPFFVWYQFLWVLIGSVITAFVYLLQRSPEAR